MVNFPSSDGNYTTTFFPCPYLSPYQQIQLLTPNQRLQKLLLQLIRKFKTKKMVSNHLWRCSINKNFWNSNVYKKNCEILASIIPNWLASKHSQLAEPECKVPIQYQLHNSKWLKKTHSSQKTKASNWLNCSGELKNSSCKFKDNRKSECGER